ncbi:hypothetical protein J7T55_007148 [Diaporthe amygdali]|uniref:uncharacterized protein n=1 Tax=Phomopsis amygdali TaxID=1214568 RepID=UPI0022FE2D7E|nr:uncharacterized protein J7T55_007148 [Diaporthe amygdali]KAJ0107936.1 hypothetical protein J7T55_007148 [Diaporthe amygdali]
MRFTSIIVAGAFALFASAQDTTATSSVTATAATTDAAQASELACLNACDAGDVNCQAKCISVPAPNGSQVNATTECVANCDQGDGSQAETDAYASCVQNCINDNYFTSGGTPAATGGSGSSGSTASGASATATGTDSSDSSSSSGSATSGSSSSSTSSGSSSSASASGSAADSIKVGMTGLGLLGFMAAAIAL